MDHYHQKTNNQRMSFKLSNKDQCRAARLIRTDTRPLKARSTAPVLPRGQSDAG